MLWCLQESIKVHLKGGKGPITVVACEVGGAEAGACFVSLEESRVRATSLQPHGNHDNRQPHSGRSQFKRDTLIFDLSF